MPLTLSTYLANGRADVATLIGELAAAAQELAGLVSRGAVSAEPVGETANGGGDVQKALDVAADRIFSKAARQAPVAFYGSEEQDGAVALNANGTLALAIDPLDGSSNIETNVSIGTIFSILPLTVDGSDVFCQPGNRQLAAGYFIYGPQLLLVVSLGQGTQVFCHNPDTGEFLQTIERMQIPEKAKEFSVNASNRRYWQEPVLRYIEDCEAGTDGPRGRNFNMRWVASAVADAYRIFLRGGIYLYPGDRRDGYADGRIRLVYEANPIAFLAEQAGGAGTNGQQRLLDIVPEKLHQRTPIVFGSREEVMEMGRYFAKA
ncbi:class 1 fructose-bisphosphatase [Aureimonas fodinaquatilis]|uniref:Fructose-1,6-bisphosphatase class 1 n=1 Tax=Aureimonas fodinaquatilis TaxID=2565783 RepID=A0A5B0E276_9HYPH|nr:class 1 fructose-bisphosphatase [Aureimonas fodinaquatilis]KAA0972225.1 class 1 fructose-bisphosphatase [Aureimonas fodinaquatilis]